MVITPQGKESIFVCGYLIRYGYPIVHYDVLRCCSLLLLKSRSGGGMLDVVHRYFLPLSTKRKVREIDVLKALMAMFKAVVKTMVKNVKAMG